VDDAGCARVVSLLSGALLLTCTSAGVTAYCPTSARLPRPAATALNSRLAAAAPFLGLVDAALTCRPWVEDALEDVTKSATVAAAAAVLPDTASASEWVREYMFSHHIYSQSKKRDMLHWSKELDVGGFYVPGKPGFILLEGPGEAVADLVRRLHRLPWQKLTTRLHEVAADSRRQLPYPFRELAPLPDNDSMMAALKAALAELPGIFAQITGL